MWILFFFFKQKTAYEMRISDWSSDVCSSDLQVDAEQVDAEQHRQREQADRDQLFGQDALRVVDLSVAPQQPFDRAQDDLDAGIEQHRHDQRGEQRIDRQAVIADVEPDRLHRRDHFPGRSEEPTSELQSLMRNSYAVFCLK